MSMVTKQEILEFWKKHETPEAKEERREVEALKKDLRIAQDSIQDAIARYRKAKLRARSKAKASSEDIFSPSGGVFFPDRHPRRLWLRDDFGDGI